ncbi:MAG: Rne/Rng family ribonuclease [Legionellaceae bacterium]|nr:Rne/Rng family ribonuclease [Legionellaceae bacterium]
MEKMLINATHPEEVRVALVDGTYLFDLDIDRPFEDVKKKGNIYKATVTRREPSLDAVFVEYGSKRQGFLPLKEIAPEYFVRPLESFDDEKPPVTALIREGQELLIQVDKEERGMKGAALTTFITLAGCYLVLMPNNPGSGGISRRIEGEERDEMRETLNGLRLPEGMGLIIRTAGLGKGQEELQNDLDMLCNQWNAIVQAHRTHQAPCLIHQEGDVVIRSIRDNLRKSIGEIIIDDHVAYVKAKQYVEQTKPDFLPNVKLYQSPVPLFSLYQIESQIELAYQRKVLLPSGGSLVIDQTEALVAIDINSAKATSGADIETTAFNTNLEAADEIARQLRLRDLGGLIVIDFIDMSSSKNQREVENRLKKALDRDRARTQVGRVSSRFGLLEMSRQRLRLSLGETEQEPCPRCEGRGVVRNIASRSLSLLRLLEEAALKEKAGEVHIQVPSDMATFLMNEKRDVILAMEKCHQVRVLVLANPYYQAAEYQITRVSADQLPKNTKRPSYALIQQPEIQVTRSEHHHVTPLVDEKLLKSAHEADSLMKKSDSLIRRLLKSIFSLGAVAKEESVPTPAVDRRPRPQQSGQRRPQHNHDRSGTSASGNVASRRRRNNNNRGNSANNNNRRRSAPGDEAQRNKRPVVVSEGGES